MAATTPFLVACELHDADAIAAALDGGLSATAPLDGKAPITWLLEMYTRSDRLPACVRALLDRGATVETAAVAAVLLDDGSAVRAAITADPAALARPVHLPSAYTPLDGASLLHVAAELGQRAAVAALLALGADVNARAAVDADGLGGQTPIFHVVNAHDGRSRPVMEQLLAAGADVAVQVAGLTWGRGFDWETTLFDLTPVAYAQLGLLPQMHRDAREIDATVRALLAAAGRPVPAMANVPNRYLRGSHGGA